MTAELSLDALLARIDESTHVISGPSQADRAHQLFHKPVHSYSDELPENVHLIIAIGGGTVIDNVKRLRMQQRPEATLVAIPTIWGSGAEVSPVMVVDSGSEKTIQLDEALRPDFYVSLPELGSTVGPQMQRFACGDTWSHALEAIISPLATESLKQKLANVIRELSGLSLDHHPEWFELSRLACSYQAEAGVGLVHGIAHTLELPLSARFPDKNWGHARLCSLYLYPVMSFNQERSTKLAETCIRFHIDMDAVQQTLRDLFDASAYQQALPCLREHWMQVLRDPCSRLNSTTVKRNDLEWFEMWGAG
ncbi:iron-containing alcohol dehydrogenase [Halioglobus pacificus]|uniref:Alcohol dehydrogenase iron-type/glycerol dehydrogenase GldA domain-containing protein n=1 Tax=Parahalioglobus pacificus TaxID=930806 RepID=A0A918XIQ3_9GAMM|nr:iron-containing alcohol dehydrogenase [Halioglobus pacificus]GHD33724.1 hypothetical protein GCM10007053_18460 [Halioglobus pacificus]